MGLWQAAPVLERLGAPFLDARLHYYWDNAFLSFDARCGNRAGDLKSQFGTTRIDYVRWGEPVGRPRHYTDHPFLVKALFQQTARFIGTEEWASRSFYLLVSFGIAAGLLLAVLGATGDLLAACLSAFVLVSLPLFSTFQVTAKYELDGMLLGTWQLVALGALLKRPSPRRRAAYAALTGLSVLAHWTAALCAALSGVYLAARTLRRKDATARRALFSTVGGGAAGFALLIGLMAFIQGGLRDAARPLSESFARRSQAAVPFGEWAARQWIYLGANFGWSFLLVALGIAAFLAARWMYRRLADGEAAGPERDGAGPGLFIGTTALTGVVWILGFRQGSYIHVYWMFWLTLPATALVGAFISSLGGRPRLRAAAAIGVLLLAFHLRALSKESYRNMLSTQLGTAEDIEFLKSLREDRFPRMVFIPLTEDPLNEWFQGPIFEYYTDRPVAILEPGVAPKVGEKLLVLRFEERAEALRELGERFGTRFTNEKRGPRFCAYDVLAR